MGLQERACVGLQEPQAAVLHLVAPPTVFLESRSAAVTSFYGFWHLAILSVCYSC
jgi:hypothetical protein